MSGKPINIESLPSSVTLTKAADVSCLNIPLAPDAIAPMPIPMPFKSDLVFRDHKVYPEGKPDDAIEFKKGVYDTFDGFDDNMVDFRHLE